MQIKSIGIDLGKTTFHVIAMGMRSQVVARKKFSRSQLLHYTANLPSSLIGMEAGVGSHFLGRTLREQGHEVRLMPAQFVRPFVKSNKNDYRDAEAIAEAVERELQQALQPLLVALEGLSERIAEYNQGIEKLAEQSYPQVELLKQVKGVGTLIALTFLLTLEDPHRFPKSRDVGCFVGLQPGRRNSGQSQPQMHISKEGDPYLRTLLVQGAQHILGPFGPDCDLRRWGLKLAERGGKSGKKRAIIATARKLAVLLHHGKRPRASRTPALGLDADLPVSAPRGTVAVACRCTTAAARR